jgi:hypothetical protein
MALSAFDDKSSKPKGAELASVLGRASALWEGLIAHLAAEYQPFVKEWKFSGAKWGWSLRLKHKKRTILYMTPCKRHFLVGFALGEKAVKAAHQSDLSDSVLTIIDEAKKYAEGRAVRIEVRTKRDLSNVEKLAAIKMAN